MTMTELKAETTTQTHKAVRTILVSQPQPQQKSPYHDIEQRYDIKVDFRTFIHVEGLAAKDFRKQRVRPDEFTAVILNSKNAVDHFFRLCEEMRIKMSEETKYFCLTETIANYLQKFIVYRKRKVFAGVKSIHDLQNSLIKHRDKEKFLLPCSSLGAQDLSSYLRELKLNFQEGMMYETVSSDLSDLSDITYDILAFFSPLDIKSLFENFPDFKQNETRIAVSGSATLKAAEERGLIVQIKTSPEAPSVAFAIENYIKLANS
jgi:uroporphyrinogen-III synthase